jgi:thiopeptide-type bacteriocin biosynthesis protein
VDSRSDATRKSSGTREARRNNLYQPLDWVLVRAPLLPIETYLFLSRPTRAQEPGQGSSDEHAPASLLANPSVRAALAIGSGDLFDAVARAEVSGEDDLGLSGKVLRYLIRMSTRPTPFGLFAGVALARWGPRTDLSFAGGRPRSRTRPDMAWLLQLVFALESRREVRRHLCYSTNPRALLHAGRYFLPEAAPMADSGAPGPAVSARATTVVRRALALARTPVPHGQLVAELAGSTGAPVEKVETLVDELWQQTLLLTDLRPPLTALHPASYVAGRLRDIPPAADSLAQLEAALGAMEEWDARPIEEAACTYRDIVGRQDAEEPAGSQVSCQVDMALTLGGSCIAAAVAEEAARAAELLLRLTPLPGGVPYLDAYRRSFEARYGPDREVPLLELLDPNIGLGPPSAFHGASGGDPSRVALRQRTLYNLALTALRERHLVVELTEKDLAALESWTPVSRTAPQSLDLSLFVVAASPADMDNGAFRVVVGPNLGASAAGRNLGRFADLLGEDAVAALDALDRAEVALHPDRLFAEIVYLPHRLRSANVTVHPHPRPYEIALGTTPGRPADRVIPLDELMVGIRDGRFYLRWTARDAEVLPCVGHMLNNLHAPDVCRFLDDLRRDGQAQISSFDWGPAAGLPVLPRVQVGRVVLSVAQWRVDAQSREQLASDKPGKFMSALRDWRTRWQVPRHVYVSFGDNRLLLDLNDAAQAEELRTEIRRLADDAQLLLQEALPGPEDAWATGSGGHFVTEFVVPLVLQPDGAPQPGTPLKPRQATAAVSAERLCPPGSDWLFAKLYAPRAFEDDLLTGPLADLCQEAIALGAADSWFFIRYADPDPHVRLRFHGPAERLLGELVPHVCRRASGLLNDGLLTRLCFDTYEREVERFGGTAGVAAAEALFFADSRAVIEMLRLSRGGLLDLDMTLLAVLSIDDLLAGLGASEAERVAWYRERVVSRTMAGDEYRRRKEALRRLLGDPDHLQSQRGGDALARVLAARRDDLARVGHELSALASAGELSQSKSALLRSYAHLHCNRLLAGDRAAEEQILALLNRARYGLSQAPYRSVGS